MLLGFLTVFTVLAVVGAVAEMRSSAPGIVPSLVLLGFAVAWWFAFRAWRRTGS
jgi:protein-S-isoprenylcysteine O-methyltransferase Ste14